MTQTIKSSKESLDTFKHDKDVVGITQKETSMEKENVVLIEANRTGYNIGQVSRTMTVYELIAELEQYDGKAKVYLSHDNGYTYGGITMEDIHEEYVDLQD